MNQRYPEQMSLSDALARSVDVVTPDLIEVRRDLHAYPELSWHEERTTDLVATWSARGDLPARRARVAMFIAGASTIAGGAAAAGLRPRSRAGDPPA